jgi:hypothetical protein
MRCCAFPVQATNDPDAPVKQLASTSSTTASAQGEQVAARHGGHPEDVPEAFDGASGERLVSYHANANGDDRGNAE